MSNPRLPVAKAQVTGAAVKNPGRHADRKKPKGTRAIGEPYAAMSDAEKIQWHEFVRDLPWLNSSHRVLLRLACHLAAAMDGADFGVSKAQALGSILSKLGATPADESKVSAGDDEPEEDEFFGPN
jgi:hypothetical protein